MSVRLFAAGLLLTAVVGCGNSSPEVLTGSPSADSVSADSASSSAPLVEASIAAAETDIPSDGGQVGGNASSDPVRRRLKAIERMLIADDHGQPPWPDIVQAAYDVLKEIKDDPARQEEFLEAIRHLLNARMQMALQGTRTETDQLFRDVEALSRRDPDSEAAAEGIYYLARFAHTRARQKKAYRTEWNVNFARWAREFAERFPEQSERAVRLLFGAGRSCEMASPLADHEDDSTLLRAEARLCYMMLQSRWPHTPQGQDAVAVLRRYGLPGKRLTQFSGPLNGGGHLSADELTGRITVICFWDSASREFAAAWLPLLKTVASEWDSQNLRIVGVSLDDDPDVCRRFIRDHGVPGDQICFDSPKQRGWNSPLVRFWGISQSPCVWLVDSRGIVVAVDMRPQEFMERIRQLHDARPQT